MQRRVTASQLARVAGLWLAVHVPLGPKLGSSTASSSAAVCTAPCNIDSMQLLAELFRAARNDVSRANPRDVIQCDTRYDTAAISDVEIKRQCRRAAEGFILDANKSRQSTKLRGK